MRRASFFVYLAILGQVILIGCSDTPQLSEPEPIPTVLHDNVVNIDDQPMTLSNIDGDAYTYLLTGTAPEIAVGDVVVSTGSHIFDDGYIGRVTSTSSIPGYSLMTLVMTEATLVDVYKSHYVNETAHLDIGIPGGIDFAYEGLEVTSNSLRYKDEIELFSGSVPVGDIGQANLNAYIGDIRFTVNEFSLLWGLTIQDSEMTEYHKIARAAAELQCDVRVTASAELEFPVPETKIFETKQKIKQGWITHCVTMTYYVGVDIAARGQASVTYDDLGAKMTLRHGVVYEGGQFTPVRDVSLTFFSSEPKLSARAELEVKPYIRIQIQDKLYCKNWAKASLWMKPYVKGNASTDFQTSWCLDVVTGCDVGGKASLKLGKIDIIDWGFDLESPTLDLYHNCWPLPLAAPGPLGPEGNTPVQRSL